MKAYFDNAAATKMADEVLEAMKPFFAEKYGNASSLHSFGQEAREALEKSRAIIARKINAEPSEIIFTSGGTESDNLALQEIAYPNRDKGNHIITTKIEHPAVLNTCKFLEKDGFKVTYLDVGKNGLIDLGQLKNSITDKTILVSIMHANNEIGTIQDIESIGKICKEKKVYFHTDAVQSFTKVPIDVKKQNITLASFSAHKLHGPKGIGALYVKKGTKIHPLIHGGSHEFGLRPGTENVAGAVGFAKATEIISQADIGRMTVLRDRIAKEIIAKTEHSWINGIMEHRLCNNVNLSFDYIEGEGILLHLDEKGIAVSTGSACSSHSLEPSHVLRAIGLSPEKCHGSIRITLSKYTTEEEASYLIESLVEVVKKLRNMSPFGKKKDKKTKK